MAGLLSLHFFFTLMLTLFIQYKSNIIQTSFAFVLFLNFLLIVLKRIKRAMCKVEFVEKRSSQDPMNMLGLEETLLRLFTVNEMQWYGLVLRRDCLIQQLLFV